MPPITSSRAGTRATHTSPLLKKPAKPVGSLFGLRRSCSNSETSNGSAVFINSMVMPEQSVPIFKKIPDDQDVQPQQHGKTYFGMRKHRVVQVRLRRATADEFVDFNRDEEGRFADGQPDRPRGAQRQADTAGEQKQPKNQGAGGDDFDVGRSDGVQPVADVGKEAPFRVEAKPAHQPLEIVLQILSDQRENAERDTQQKQALGQLDAGDDVERRRT